MSKHSRTDTDIERVPVFATGQTLCTDAAGAAVECAGSGQDAEGPYGQAWPQPRFETEENCIRDVLTGLVWSRNATPAEFPMTWSESLDAVAALNAAGYAGRSDWRMPGRRELHSLVSFAANKPALPEGHPFRNVFLGWYWSSTSFAGSGSQPVAGMGGASGNVPAEPNGGAAASLPPVPQGTHAWRVHMEGGRMFYGNKDEYSLLWPVAGTSSVLAETGQRQWYDGAKRDAQHGVPFPENRFMTDGETIMDRLTGVRWMRHADACGPVLWAQALEAVAILREKTGRAWRLPTIRELESLADSSMSFPALPAGHPFTGVGNEYWSSTSSSFAYDWAMAWYMGKGAVGVGFKTGEPFLVWPVCTDEY